MPTVTGIRPTAVIAAAASVIVTGTGNEAAVTAWRSGPRSASSYRFKTLWFDDNLDGKLPKKGTAAFTYGLGKLNDLYDENGGNAMGPDNNVTMIWQSVLDKDGDLMRGDFGKVDLVQRQRQPGDHQRERGDRARKPGRQGGQHCP